MTDGERLVAGCCEAGHGGQRPPRALRRRAPHCRALLCMPLSHRHTWKGVCPCAHPPTPTATHMSTPTHPHSLDVTRLHHGLPGEPRLLTHLQRHNVALLHLRCRVGVGVGRRRAFRSRAALESRCIGDGNAAEPMPCPMPRPPACPPYLDRLVLHNEQRAAAAPVVGVQAQLLVWCGVA